MESKKIVCTGKGSYNYVTECDGILNGIEENIVYEDTNYNKSIYKVKYAICPKNEKIMIRNLLL